MNKPLKLLIKVTVILTFCIFVFISKAGRAQQTEGVARYLINYNWVKMMEAVDYLSKERKEQINYMWGNDAEWKMYGTLVFSGKKSKYEDSDEKADADYEGNSWRKDEYFINRDFENNRIKDIIKMLGKVYIIDDTLVAPAWKILNDIKEVAGHICMNASWNDTLKKQKVIGWFALDIPLSIGPERYCGLPGMILEVDVNNGAKVLTVDKIEFKSLTTELDLPKKIKGKLVNEAAFLAILKKHMDERRKAEEPPFWGIRY